MGLAGKLSGGRELIQLLLLAEGDVDKVGPVSPQVTSTLVACRATRRMDIAAPAIAYSTRVLARYLQSIGIACKNLEEARFWKRELREYLNWYRGETDLHGVPPPTSMERVKSSSDELKNACMTWNTVFQQVKYLSDLNIERDVFSGKVVCDIGAGPHANALCFSGCEIYGVDHFVDIYREFGFPVEDYERRYHFVQAKSEKTPFPDSFFDAVISVNAIDHVDDIYATSLEMSRFLKTGGLMRIMTHYHRPTVTEPSELCDARIRQLFGWVKGLRKIAVARSDYMWVRGTEHKPDWNSIDPRSAHDSHDNVFVIWGNF